MEYLEGYMPKMLVALDYFQEDHQSVVVEVVVKINKKKLFQF